jgi:hypothetical protein
MQNANPFPYLNLRYFYGNDHVLPDCNEVIDKVKCGKTIESRFLASLRNDTKVNCDTVSQAGIQKPTQREGII